MARRSGRSGLPFDVNIIVILFLIWAQISHLGSNVQTNCVCAALCVQTNCVCAALCVQTNCVCAALCVQTNCVCAALCVQTNCADFVFTN